ncbi:restriction endonuclease subunit S [Photorhabdus bodei]|uniref:Restriction endonuclease subunit S n=1 Tax=Photorhabdus bodei TaxID=2029681 RepID=A0AAW6BMP9_9GAMM|nr:restriction endonuclease subunit S [Photorhabdus bodei]MCC8465759.1 restriction endonuclease subunit S [Photorhabdus bodei]MDB6373930.1 restriction endonuclease subunit S [Photorhabdus bodei]
MSNMSFMEKLLDGVEVEWKALGMVADIISGYVFPKVHQGDKNSNIPFYKVSDMNNFGNEMYMNISNNYLSDVAFNKLRVKTAPKGTIIFPKIGAAISTNKKRILSQDSVFDNNISGLIPRKEILSGYLFHFFQTLDLMSFANGAGAVPSISKSTLEKLQIPVPPLNIQTEIVRILDTFTELTAKLTAELTARKKQYNHYRDQLLSFEEGEVEWKTLGEVGEFIRGKRFTKADYVEHGISVIHYGEIYTQYGVSTSHVLSKVSPEMATTLRYAEPGDVVITDVGETVEDVGKAVAWIGNERVAIHDHCYAFRHAMNPKFVSYCMQTTPFIAEKAKYVARTKVNTLLINGFAKISIPVPSIEEQNRLVGILDKFDALTNSISEGLPREIELRQKQYEYYRDLLLSFPKPEVAA